MKTREETESDKEARFYIHPLFSKQPPAAAVLRLHQRRRVNERLTALSIHGVERFHRAGPERTCEHGY